MKKRIFSIITMLFIASFQVFSQTHNIPFVSCTPVYDVTQRNLRQVILDDGVYEVLVDYKSNTTSREQYVLDVRIQNDNITHIYFNNGGYVHNGVNYSDYTWR